MIHTITKKQAEELEQLADSINQIFFDNGEFDDEYYIYFNGIRYINAIFFHDFKNYIHITTGEDNDNFYQIAGEDDATDDINLAIEDMQIFNANDSFDELMNDLKDTKDYFKNIVNIKITDYKKLNK